MMMSLIQRKESSLYLASNAFLLVLAIVPGGMGSLNSSVPGMKGSLEENPFHQNSWKMHHEQEINTNQESEKYEEKHGNRTLTFADVADWLARGLPSHDPDKVNLPSKDRQELFFPPTNGIRQVSEAGWINLNDTFDGGVTIAAQPRTLRGKQPDLDKSVISKVVCHGVQEQLDACGMAQCDASVETSVGQDCKWEWTDWTACSCLSETKSRHRNILMQATGSGKQCDGPSEQSEQCNCEVASQACSLSQWTSWSLCSQTCGGGVQHRQRQIIRHASENGAACSGVLDDSQACSDQPCNIKKERDVNCKWSDWTPWSACSAACGGGQMTRSRNIEIAPSGNGAKCPALGPAEYRECQPQPCSNKLDCEFSAWSDWGQCMGSCRTSDKKGLKQRQRIIAHQSRMGGNGCKGDLEEFEPCQLTFCSSDQDCEMSSWGEWDDCSATCSGIQTSRRHVLRSAQGMGKLCEGSLIKLQPCGKPCHNEAATSSGTCKLSPFSSWGPCTLPDGVICGIGFQTRSRVVLEVSGSCTDQTLSDVQSCTVPCATSTKSCTWSAWSKWSGCSVTCGIGQRKRMRQVSTETDSAECSAADSVQTEPCGTPCATEAFSACTFGDWDDWSIPTGDCGSQQISRTRSAFPAERCSQTVTELASKELAPCGACLKQDCEFGEWGLWSSCACNGVKTRNRVIKTMPSCGGKACTGADEETQPCEPSCSVSKNVDCNYGLWSEWSACSISCGGKGNKYRLRVVTEHATGAGQECSGKSRETEKCTTPKCKTEHTKAGKSIDCEYAPWQTWGPCSQTCGEGMKSRSRYVRTEARNGGTACSAGGLTQLAPCTEKPCASGNPQDCLFEMWSSWTNCPVSCGGGKSWRTRGILRQASGGGAPCKGVMSEPKDCGTATCAKGPVPCAFTDWSKWTSCTRCGSVKTRSREIIAGQNGGASCEGGLQESKGCPECTIESKIVQDCKFTSWESEACLPDNGRCGMGQQRWRRNIDTPRMGGGQACDGPVLKTTHCNVKCGVEAREIKKDCAWKEWSKWSDCDQPCGGGIQHRSRDIAVMPSNDGAPCVAGDSTEVQPCNIEKCASSVSCGWGDWGPWNEPVETCGTVSMLRTRLQKLVYPNNEIFAGTALDQLAASCQGVQDQLSEKTLAPCAGEGACTPVPCAFAQWTAWTACSEGQQRVRYRAIQTYPKCGGTPCQGSSSEVEPCTLKIDVAKMVHCELGDWEDWFACSVTCGVGYTSRARIVKQWAQNGGKPCDHSQLEEKSVCTESPCVKVDVVEGKEKDCTLSEWSGWGLCNRDCGGGFQMRARHIVQHRTNVNRQPCTGLLQDYQPCNKQDCGKAVDCEFDAWQPWGACTNKCNGYKERMRILKHRAVNGGKNCQGSLHEVQPCSKKCKANDSGKEVDCILSPWSQWSACTVTCNGGQQERSRHVKRASANGGIGCAGDMREVQVCGTAKCDFASIDCKWGSWSSWDSCDQPCGGGTQRRSRDILELPVGNGRSCTTGDSVDLRTCNPQPCMVAISCDWSIWSPWTKPNLECGVVSIQRSRHQSLSYPSNGNNAGVSLQQLAQSCQGTQEELSLVDLGPCTKDTSVKGCTPVDCEYGAWTEWTQCVAGGQKVRRREIAKYPSCNGDTCQGNSQEMEPCAGTGLTTAPVDCEVDDWNPWSACSLTCGGGVKSRTRFVKSWGRNGGSPCFDTDISQTSQCNTQLCQGPSGAKVDCQMDTWSDWSVCSVTCGIGYQSRARQVKRWALNGGSPCGKQSLKEEGVCQNKPCNSIVTVSANEGQDCVLSDWSGWGACNRACGGGFQMRMRDVAQQRTSINRQPCIGKLQDYKACNSESCEPVVDCIFGDWGTWSTCTSACNGYKERSRVLKQPAKNGGKQCDGPLHAIEPCGSSDCKAEIGKAVDCILSPWTSWSACPVTCGGGQQDRSRHVSQPPRNGGKPCNANTREIKVCGSLQCSLSSSDCKWDDWSDWAQCDQPCGGGMQQRSRNIASLPLGDGAHCTAGDAAELRSCNTQKCELAVSCDWGVWSPWSKPTTDCGVASKKRSRQQSLTYPNTLNFPGQSLQQLSASCVGIQDQLSTVDLGPCATPKSENCEAQNCVLGRWTSWSKCSEGGQQIRHRAISAYPECGGKPCVGGTMEIKPCYQGVETKQPTDCEIGDWGAWSGCSATCDGGVQSRAREVKKWATNGGKPCMHADISEVQKCNTNGCVKEQVESKDCELGSWTNWNQCNADCGGGFKSRTRNVKQHRTGVNTKPCIGDLQEYLPCNTQPCSTSTDCKFSSWGLWSACSDECNGYKERYRIIEQRALNGGTQCQGPQNQLEPCKEKVCNKKVKQGPKKHCILSKWSAWSSCTKTCGGGQQERIRHVVRNAENGGQACSGPLQELQGCGSEACTGAAPVDCQWGLWSDWNTCTANCNGGQQFRTRHVIMEPQNGGHTCDSLQSSETKACNTQACESASSVECDWGPWGQWQMPEAKCGKVTKRRVRSMGPEAACSSTQTEVAPVELEPCGSCTPVDCKFDEWGPWSACSQGGLRQHMRIIARYPDCGGKPCEGDEREVEPCGGTSVSVTEGQMVKVDCEYSMWSPWSGCTVSCGEGKKNRVRVVARNAANGGAGCSEKDTESQVCKMPICPTPKPCVYSEWSSWSSCSTTCGVGEKRRFRHVDQIAQNGGHACTPDALSEVAECQGISCEVPGQDCKIGDWSAWSVCDVNCGEGQKSRSRSILQIATAGGKGCTGLLQDFTPCQLPPCTHKIDCKMGSWGAWSPCTRKCSGFRERRREPSAIAQGGGKGCEGSLVEAEPCNTHCQAKTQDLKPQDCEFTSWSTWAPCSSVCGDGQTSRVRSVNKPALNGGKGCTGPVTETQSCSMKCAEQASVDCTWSMWSKWSGCSVTCGGGQQTRSREILKTAARGGKPCVATDAAEMRGCAQTPCAETNCQWSQWSKWSGCDGRCDSQETKQRLRIPVAKGSVTKRSLQAQAAECGNQVQSQTQPCGGKCSMDSTCVDAAWSLWSEWSECTCSGLQYRERNPAVLGSSCGKALTGLSRETKECPGCAANAAPVDCAYEAWAAWSDCSAKCGTGQQFRSRSIETVPSNGGKQCVGPLRETQSCQGTRCGKKQDCIWDEWGKWSACSRPCGPGLRERKRVLKRLPKNGGQACAEIDSAEVTPCMIMECDTGDEEAVVDCTWTSWTTWSPCTASCGGGYQVRSRSPNAPKNGGRPCDGNFEDYVSCNQQECTAMVDNCIFSPWNSWSACSGQCNGHRERSRSILKYNNQYGKACSGSLQELLACGDKNCYEAKDCELSPWEPWSPCSTTCGAGMKTRSRFVKSEAVNGGEACIGDMEESASCKVKNCAKVAVKKSQDCEWGAWSACSACDDATCTCTKSRVMSKLVENGGVPCQGPSMTVEKCPCSSRPEEVTKAVDADCKQGEWTSWTECSRTCGSGQQFRYRSVEKMPIGNGKPCTGSQSEVQPCKISKCTYDEQDCALSLWSEWSTCSTTCGGGTKMRQRSISTEPKAGGKPCIAVSLSETTPCSQVQCGVQEYCVWSPWTTYQECSATCGGGQRIRTRAMIKTTEVPGGEALAGLVMRNEMMGGVFQKFRKPIILFAMFGFLVFVYGVCVVSRRVKNKVCCEIQNRRRHREVEHDAYENLAEEEEEDMNNVQLVE
eukprot:gnl/MRDRNA2_/MRDRNA2_81439_c0_seq1.p1 gnl/MRDRNA2_/MRDRNA2_81439_c0~~gnl/MRDRNA2_/MRDRNA2_81439_c0_seq1.p1  ORF type:complete len:3654 (+),score=523.54 gnl/MRDRNA2_/MRDRNA2_81439_c0_seq1:90-11051(+)